MAQLNAEQRERVIDAVRGACLRWYGQTLGDALSQMILDPNIHRSPRRNLGDLRWRLSRLQQIINELDPPA